MLADAQHSLTRQPPDSLHPMLIIAVVTHAVRFSLMYVNDFCKRKLVLVLVWGRLIWGISLFLECGTSQFDFGNQQVRVDHMTGAGAGI